MPEQMTQTIQLKSQAGNTNQAAMTFVTYSNAERKARAVKNLLGFWALAVLSIPIMIAHLVLIPGFTIAGIVMATKRWKTDKEAESVSGTCPACGEEITINLEKKGDLPQWQYCPSCNDSLELDALPETASAQA
jgi:predicted RNA-binding Zn-ribbon protein involved in translation (DUF1610 family)